LQGHEPGADRQRAALARQRGDPAERGLARIPGAEVMAAARAAAQGPTR
ncbi:hypothetical protein HLX62_24470, partial [Escherichia coli]|nr:hypothetical protein [Escherichia coli]